MSTRLNSPTPAAAATASPFREPLCDTDEVAEQCVGLYRKAEELRELPDEDREGETCHVADLRRLRQ